jgi:peptidoglycan/LPS O-acetylase OafA/YrhL
MSNEPPARVATSFRPDVQGIRAIAVLLVVANHLSPASLPGGYVGVDVFFVVSGYLITGLLLSESARKGRISLGDFYARRARRIIPAATVVTVVTVVASLMTLPLLRVQEILKDAVWVTFFAANIRMADVGTDYFAIGQPPSPLRHYWSLSVEEQFYLVWPVLLVLCLLMLRRVGKVADFRKLAGVVIGVVIVASLAWSMWATYHSPVTAYFSSLTRAYELGIGAACAVIARRVALGQLTRQVLAAGGLLTIAAVALLYSDATDFPGIAALVPVLGTAALVVAGQGAATPTLVARGLSWKPATTIGDWSYSIYLWHWPLIVLVRSHVGPERFASVGIRVGVLVVALVLSWATYRFIEQPFRRGRWQRPRLAMLIYPVSIATVVVVVIASNQVVRYRLGEFSNDPPITAAQFGGAKALGKDPYVALVKASVLAAQQGEPVPSHLTPGLVDLRAQTAPLGDCDYRTGTTDLCPTGDADADKTIVVLGDSHARALSPAIQEIGEKDHYRVYVLVYSGCTATSLQQVDRATGRVWTGCEDFKAWALQVIDDLQPDLVVVSTASGQVVDPDTGETMSAGDGFARYADLLQTGWTELFEHLRSDAGAVYVVGNTPKLPRETGVCLSQGDPDLGDCAFKPGPFSVREAKASFRAARAADIGFVDAQKWFCADGLCPSVVGRYITMRDSEHVTPDYARWLAAPLATALGVTPPPS